MDFNRLALTTEKFRIQAIGEPVWISQKKTFEYTNQTVKEVVVLKSIRATQGIKAMTLLCEQGLFVDMGAIYRCIHDCSAETYFLLEEYPKSSKHVDQLVKAFFEANIDGYLKVETDHVSTQKIHSAMVRVLTGLEKDEKTRVRILNIYKTFSGYTHANYAHIMQMYGGPPSDRNFKLSGVPSLEQKTMHMQLVEQAYLANLYSIGFAAHKFGLIDLYHEIVQSC